MKPLTVTVQAETTQRSRDPKRPLLKPRREKPASGRASEVDAAKAANRLRRLETLPARLGTGRARCTACLADFPTC